MSGSKIGGRRSYEPPRPLSSTQELDAFLDQYELKHGLVGNADKNLETYANNDDSEMDLKGWEIAKRIKKHNDSYRTVTKLLRELQSARKSQYSTSLVTTQSSKWSESESTTSCSSEDCWTNDSRHNYTPSNYNRLPYRDNGPVQALIDPPPPKDLMKSKEKLKPADQAILLEAGGGNQSKSDMVAKPATKIPIVMDKSKMTKSFRYKLNNPVKNPPPLPSLEGNSFIRINPQSLRPPDEVIDLQQKTRRIGDRREENFNKIRSNKNHEKNERLQPQDSLPVTKEEEYSFMGGWLDLPKTMIMSLLSSSEPTEEDRQKERDRFIQKKKEEFQIGSVLGAPCIAGMRDMPQPTFVRPANTSRFL